MALPKAAQKQLEAAERMHAEVYPVAENVPDKPTLASVSNVENLATITEANAERQDSATAEQVESSGKESDPAHWKHKYEVLQGKYNSEVPKLQQANASLNGRIKEVETQMSRLSVQMTQPAQTIQPGSYITDEERADYGDDMIEVVKKAAREEFEPMLATLQQENGQLRNLLGGMQQQSVLSAKEQMLGTLDNELSTWREMNQQPEFLGWLENVDPYSGHKKLDLLRQAFENNNTARVLAFFKGFLNENATYSSSQAPNNEPRLSLDTLVAPGRAHEGGDTRAQEGNATGRIWTGALIKEFYSDINRGVYRARPEERLRLETDLFSAQSTGRIAP